MAAALQFRFKHADTRHLARFGATSLLVAFITFTLACNREESHSMSYNSRPLSEIQAGILMHGDPKCYMELHTIYLRRPAIDLLGWALVMANKYDCPTAYLDVYYCLKRTFANASGDFSLVGMDAKTKDMALEYLNGAVLRGVEGAEMVRDSVIYHLNH